MIVTTVTIPVTSRTFKIICNKFHIALGILEYNHNSTIPKHLHTRISSLTIEFETVYSTTRVKIQWLTVLLSKTESAESVVIIKLK